MLGQGQGCWCWGGHVWMNGGRRHVARMRSGRGHVRKRVWGEYFGWVRGVQGLVYVWMKGVQGFVRRRVGSLLGGG